MQEVREFIQNYSPASTAPIRYTGGGRQDANQAFRLQVLQELFEGEASVVAGDDLLRDLFVAHREFGVEADSSGIEGLAVEVLKRGFYDTFVWAWTLPLGMDMGAPLEIAVISLVREKGMSVAADILQAIDRRIEIETETTTRVNLEFWNRWVQKRAGWSS